MWEISSTSQILTFLYSIVLGFSIGIIFDLPRSFRPFVKHKSAYLFISDLSFWILTAFITFCFYLVFTNGELRGFVVIGMLFGFITERLTLSLILVRFFKKTLNFLRKTYNKFIVYRNKKIDKLLYVLTSAVKIGKIILKKCIKSAKKP